MAILQTLQDRIKNSVIIDENGCWIWQKFTDKDGYGQIKMPGRRMRRAHRISYTVFRGEFDDSLQIDHLCRVRSCVNPKHLEPVTCAENIRRGEGGLINASKTHCPHGHEYFGANIIRERDGARKCRTCVYKRNNTRKHLKALANPKKHYSQVLKERTHCRNGHEFSLENTYFYPSGRKCKTWNRDASRRNWKRSARVG